MADGLIPVEELNESRMHDRQRDIPYRSDPMIRHGFSEDKESYSNDRRQQQQRFGFEDGMIPVPTHSQSYRSVRHDGSGCEDERQVSPYESKGPDQGLGDDKWDYGQGSAYRSQTQDRPYQPDYQQDTRPNRATHEFGQEAGYADQTRGPSYPPSYQQNPASGDAKPFYTRKPQPPGLGWVNRLRTEYESQQQSPQYGLNQQQGYVRTPHLVAPYQQNAFQPTGLRRSSSPDETNFMPTPRQSDHYETGPQVVTTSRQIPQQLDITNVTVPFQTVPMKVDTEAHTVHALLKSTESVQNMSNILGTYLEEKRLNEARRLNYNSIGLYKRSKLEVQMYNHLMHKLESLSADVSKHKRLFNLFVQALSLHRRRVFADLYNENALVRCFCKELADGPMALPQLDGWALGINKTTLFSHRATTRTLRLSASTELLAQVRTVVLVDDSGSMLDPGHMSWTANPDYRSGGYGVFAESRWQQAQRTLAEVAPLVSAKSPHGIDLHFLNREAFYLGLRTTSDVNYAFNQGHPYGATYTGQRINDILDSYMCTLRYNRSLMPLNLIVLTDGEASDEEHLHWAIEEHVTKIVQRGYPAHQFGVEFVQVGDDEMATRHLEKLEEEVSRHHQRFQRDVVGVTPTTRMSNMNSDKLLAIAVSGIDARINGYMRQRGTNV